MLGILRRASRLRCCLCLPGAPSAGCGRTSHTRKGHKWTQREEWACPPVPRWELLLSPGPTCFLGDLLFRRQGKKVSDPVWANWHAVGNLELKLKTGWQVTLEHSVIMFTDVYKCPRIIQVSFLLIIDSWVSPLSYWIWIDWGKWKDSPSLISHVFLTRLAWESLLDPVESQLRNWRFRRQWGAWKGEGATTKMPLRFRKGPMQWGRLHREPGNLSL